ncbi:hypothetical protein Pcinc_015183 [Petrolisthes cinctipes]|uniref:WAP domain-containing protein n=1 Tax=Petrolisthes cinctipes TaxID=88211 RepID=A0AAE1FTI1_PETCI|nr:hypothetical protein Pcinc_015183 [Petrolisthes cinctipes]
MMNNKMMLVMVAVMTLMVMEASSQHDAQCYHWCRRPSDIKEGPNSVYCCAFTRPTIQQIKGGVHPGTCPPHPYECPGVRVFSKGPQVCAADGYCGPNSKCCFDTCLKHNTCKPAILDGPIIEPFPFPPFDVRNN